MRNLILVYAVPTSESEYLLLHLDPGISEEAREFVVFRIRCA